MNTFGLEKKRDFRKECILCGMSSINFRVLYNLEKFNIVKCMNCLLVQRDVVLTEETSKNLYAKSYYENEHRDYFYTYEQEKGSKFEKELKRIEKIVPTKGRVLDVGCGIGTFLKIAKQRGWKIYGQDISPYATQMTNKSTQAEVFNGDLSASHYQKEFFDLVVSWDVLNHSETPLRLLKKIYELVRPNGLVVIQVNAGDSLIYILSSWLYIISFTLINFSLVHAYPIHQSSYFSKVTLSQALQYAGFEIITIKRSPFHTKSCSVRKKGLVPRLSFTVINAIGNLFGRRGDLIAYARKSI